MAAKGRRGRKSPKPAAHPAVHPAVPSTPRPPTRPPTRSAGAAASGPGRIAIVVAAIVVALVAVLGVELAFMALQGSGGSSPSASPAAQTPSPAAQTPSPVAQTPSPAAQPSIGVVVQGRGGTWTNVTPDELAQMLQAKDFTLLNVKTPYIGEIEGTDLWIPYTELAIRAHELPADKGAKIVVYCRTGTTSAIAAQTLIDLGYTNIWNMAGGMEAWQASGRTLVNKNR